TSVTNCRSGTDTGPALPARVRGLLPSVRRSPGCWRLRCSPASPGLPLRDELQQLAWFVDDPRRAADLLLGQLPETETVAHQAGGHGSGERRVEIGRRVADHHRPAARSVAQVDQAGRIRLPRERAVSAEDVGEVPGEAELVEQPA